MIRGAALALVMTFAPLGAASDLRSATAGGWLGIYPAARFRVTDGRCADCSTIRQALWYFRDETIAVPMPGEPVAGFSAGVRAFDDVRAWAAARVPDAPADFPPLVWIAAPQVLRGARLSADATELVTGDGVLPFRLVPKIPLNRSYFDPSSARYFSQRAITVRGTSGAEGFTVRTLWPEDFRLTAGAPARALPVARSSAESLRSLMREEKRGGAQSPFVANTLWQRADGQTDGHTGGGDWTGRTVLAFMVNGAQGDDDEAHGGHFAIVTGRIEPDGAIGNWLVNDFYTLDAESEKGILAAPVTLDNYLADLNAGQGWYRPSYVVVAVLSNPRAAELVQSALGRVYNQFYRHQLTYYHPDQNCTSFSVDTMRALGWDVPGRGPTSRLLAVLGFPFIAVKEGSIAKAKLAFDYLVTDQTRMMPAAALEEIFGSLLALGRDAGTGAQAGGPLERMLAADLDVLAYLRFPQIPSSRAFGAAPAVTTWEYRMMVPDDPALKKIVPVPPRPFPDALRDPDLIPPSHPPSDLAAMVWGVVLVVGIPWVAWTLWRRWRERRAAA